MDDLGHLPVSASLSSGPDFEAVFEALPSPYMVVDRSLNYVEANAAYCQATERRREELIGRHVFDLFPNPGPEGRRLRESFERVLETGRPDTLPLIPYPIPLPLSRGGGLEMRYWSAAHVPLFDAEGRVAWVLQNTVDVTDLQRLKEIAYGPGAAPRPGEKDLLLRTREAEEINRALLEETQGLRDLFMQAPGFMAVLTGPELTFALVNHAYQQLIGHRQVIGKPLAEALPEIREQGFVELLQGVLADAKPYIGESVSVRLRRTPDGPLEERFVDFIYQPLVRQSGEAWGVFVEGSDVTARVLAERQQKLLLDELNHRVKNTLATVQAIAAQTRRSSPNPAEFHEAFESRLMALSAAHDLLTATSWRSAALRDVLLAEFRPYGADRYRLDGPDVGLSPSEAVALGLLLHELATNAAKYGALSNDTGRVAVTWSVHDSATPPRLELHWTEADGPPVTPPSRRGFGSRLIETSLRGALAGEARLEFAPEGVRCHVELPLRGEP